MHITYVATLLLLASCHTDRMDSMEEQPGSGEPPVHLVVTRAQQREDGSFNADAAHFEDRVHDLATLVFDSFTGEKVCEHYDEHIASNRGEHSFTVKMTPGRRDFYFIANMPMAPLQAIADRNAMLTYLRQMRTLDEALYNQASADKGFPMLRVYNNQTVSRGGSAANPTPFLPDGTDRRVKLIRAVAKVEINLRGSIGRLKSISYSHARTGYLLGSVAETPDSQLKPETRLVEVSPGNYIYYLPERVLGASRPVWNPSAPDEDIHYFTVETKRGEKFQVPLLSNGEKARTSYLNFAQGKEGANPVKPDFSIRRNNHYKMAVTMPKEGAVEVNTEVAPWNLVESGMGFAEPKAELLGISFEGGMGEQSGDKKTIALHGQTKAVIKLKVTRPVGGIWSVSITNGLDFELKAQPESELQQGEMGATAGVGSSATIYVMYIRPLKRYMGTPRFTQVYLTLNGKEVQLHSGAGNNEAGPQHRTLFKQVE